MKRAWFQDPKRRRTVLRVVGLCVGLLFFAAAVHFAMRERMEFAKAMEALRDPPPVAVFAVLASVAVGAVLTALLFHILMRRFGKVPFWEMQALIAASAFANYLPLQDLLVAWHTTDSDMAFARRTRCERSWKPSRFQEQLRRSFFSRCCRCAH
jgi:hypothetical protein